jgi:hypothetical protein
MGKTFVLITEESTVPLFTPGKSSVVLLRICVSVVDTIICQVVRKIGKGNSKDDKTALLNKIYFQKNNRKIITAEELIIIRSFTITQLAVIHNTTYNRD